MRTETEASVRILTTPILGAGLCEQAGPNFLTESPCGARDSRASDTPIPLFRRAPSRALCSPSIRKRRRLQPLGDYRCLRAAEGSFRQERLDGRDPKPIHSGIRTIRFRRFLCSSPARRLLYLRHAAWVGTAQAAGRFWCQGTALEPSTCSPIRTCRM